MMLRVLRITTLVLALSFSAQAGDMQYGAIPPPPPSTNSSPDSNLSNDEITLSGAEEQELGTTDQIAALVNLLSSLLRLI